MAQKYYLYNHYKPRAVRDLTEVFALDLGKASESEVLGAIKKVKDFETKGEWLELYSPRSLKAKDKGGYRYFKTKQGKIYEALISSGAIVNEQGFNASKEILKSSLDTAKEIIENHKKLSQTNSSDLKIDKSLNDRSDLLAFAEKVIEDWESINNPILLTEEDNEMIKLWIKSC